MRNLQLLWFASILVTVLLVGCGGTNSAGTLAATPSITSVSPTEALPGGALTIVGANLTGTYTMVSFSGPQNAEVAASSGGTTSVSATVPSTLIPGTYNVYVIATDANGDTSGASNSVQISVL